MACGGLKPAGLRMLRNAGEKCALFENPVFSRIATWYISTSNLTSEYFSNWGWGEVVPQGACAATTPVLQGAPAGLVLMQQSSRSPRALC